jgi:hypothetical protein
MMVGLANYVATAQSGRAEVSVVVAHEQHERGVGTALLRILGLLARDNGIHHLEAFVLAENHSMQRMVAEAGWPCSCARDGLVLCYDVDLDALGDVARPAQRESQTLGPRRDHRARRAEEHHPLPGFSEKVIGSRVTRNGSRRDDSRRRRAAAAASLEADRR